MHITTDSLHLTKRVSWMNDNNKIKELIILFVMFLQDSLTLGQNYQFKSFGNIFQIFPNAIGYRTKIQFPWDLDLRSNIHLKLPNLHSSFFFNYALKVGLQKVGFVPIVVPMIGRAYEHPWSVKSPAVIVGRWRNGIKLMLTILIPLLVVKTVQLLQLVVTELLSARKRQNVFVF